MENKSKEKWDIVFLGETLYELIEKFQPKQRFIHPNTIYNFIFHFDSFKDKRIKQHIYDNLFQMLQTLQEVSIEDLNPKFGALLYDTYIQPLLSYYNVRQIFFVHINWKYLASFQVAILFFLFIFKAPYCIGLIVLFLFIGLYIYGEKKRKQRRLYGVYF